ncbi:hypothetical protein [Vibrio harveyi]|uniref:hypothetical protein n=1 Tax=Vibrio harveyi TaxID=669 RepID=UPI0023806F96|nr:hypothetical protein [Vibrio harveyi]
MKFNLKRFKSNMNFQLENPKTIMLSRIVFYVGMLAAFFELLTSGLLLKLIEPMATPIYNALSVMFLSLITSGIGLHSFKQGMTEFEDKVFKYVIYGMLAVALALTVLMAVYVCQASLSFGLIAPALILIVSYFKMKDRYKKNQTLMKCVAFLMPVYFALAITLHLSKIQISILSNHEVLHLFVYYLVLVLFHFTYRHLSNTTKSIVTHK